MKYGEANMDLEKRILKYIEEMDGSVSFAELSKHIDGFSGEEATGYQDKNILLWPSISAEAANAIHNLEDKDLIEVAPTQYLVYFVDGVIPNFPIAKKIMKYKKPHWLPVCIHLGPKHPRYLGKRVG